MEIIAKVDNYNFIVKISKDDLEKLTGYYYDKKTFMVGEEVKISELYNQLNNLNYNHKEIKKMAHSLKTAAGMLEKIDPVFSKEDE